MDINTLRGIATILAIAGFSAVCYWAFSKKNTKAFKDASMLPFADDENDQPPNDSKTEELKNNE
ncbi:MAG: cbb3-type cytochrome c oxidase subunit 3 [Saccharospirillaceae bacterium]|nr:cbb3-type cytochrome c oxidase subunit 3 [Pseudomonadales bacterium]NRB78235.1 cbb3-type cytochrome c oxidase subunit 3 [Saccharospirillaceae bacterium]